MPVLLYNIAPNPGKMYNKLWSVAWIKHFFNPYTEMYVFLYLEILISDLYTWYTSSYNVVRRSGANIENGSHLGLYPLFSEAQMPKLQ